MVLSPLEYVIAGMWGLQTLSAAVSAMPRPKKDGWYSFLYKFAHSMTNNLDAWFEQKYHMALPRVVDESAVSTVTTPDSQTQIAVTKTTTNP